MIGGRIKNLVRNLNYLMKHSLWDQREEDIVYLTSKILDDGIYEYDLSIPDYARVEILDKEQSIRKIVSENKSFVRINDGEVRLMCGISQPFQKYEKTLVNQLIALLKQPREDVLVGINRGYYLPYYKAQAGDFMRRNAYDFRKFLDKYIDYNVEYLDGACTFYKWGDQSAETALFWNCWREAFRDKRIVIVCGEHILDSLQYDIFELAVSKRFIYGPRKHAWDKHEELIDRIKREVDKDEYLIFILGMAGKAMIPEVTDLGYIAWDVGHLAKSYDAYRNDMPNTKENIERFYSPD